VLVPAPRGPPPVAARRWWVPVPRSFGREQCSLLQMGAERASPGRGSAGGGFRCPDPLVPRSARANSWAPGGPRPAGAAPVVGSGATILWSRAMLAPTDERREDLPRSRLRWWWVPVPRSFGREQCSLLQMGAVRASRFVARSVARDARSYSRIRRG